MLEPYANASADGLPVDISHFAARPRQRRARYRALALQTSPDCQGKLVVECAHRLAGAHRSLLDKRTPRSSAHRVVKHTDVSTATRELNDNIATAALAFEASLNESELMLRCVGWRDGSLHVRRGLRPHCCTKFIVPTHAAMHPEGSCRRTATSILLAFDAHTLEKICENTSNLNSTSCPTFDSAYTSTDLPSDQFSVFLLQKDVMMTNEPPQGLRGATTSSASS